MIFDSLVRTDSSAARLRYPNDHRNIRSIRYCYQIRYLAHVKVTVLAVNKDKVKSAASNQASDIGDIHFRKHDSISILFCE